MPPIFEWLFCPEIVIGLLLVAVLLAKVRLMRPAALGPLFPAVLKHDAAIFGLLFLLYFGSSAIGFHSSGGLFILSKILLCVFLSIALLYVADAVAYYFFATRLYASDLVTFSSEFSAGISLLRTGWRALRRYPTWKLASLAIITAITLYSLALFVISPSTWQVAPPLALVAAVLFAALYYLPLPEHLHFYGDKPLFENFVERNLNFFYHANFSESFRERLCTSSTPLTRVLPGRNKRLNVIVVIVESLSAYHSRFFSGVEDWTPRLDEIAGKETALTNFHANGWTTIGGLVALLGREFPLVPERTQFNKWGSPRLSDFLDLPCPLPRTLAEQGYLTEFISSGQLSFLDQDKWLESIGFQKLIGHDDPRFDLQKIRGPFQSVPDGILYDVALKEIEQMPADRPYFLVIQTFWSHRPFMSPNGDELPGEEPVIRETDAQIGSLYDRLVSAGFGQNGILFITGDHRAMEPFRRDEMARFGNSARTRIPAVIFTRAVQLPRLLSQDFQQRDLGASIEALNLPEFSLRPHEGSFLAEPVIAGGCVLHAHGDDRDLVFVKSGDKEGTVRTAGDATRFVSGTSNDPESVIRTINLTRLRPRPTVGLADPLCAKSGES